MVYNILFPKGKSQATTSQEMEQNRKVGTPLIGGPFNLVDTNGNSFTEKSLVDPKERSFLYYILGSLIVLMYAPKSLTN